MTDLHTVSRENARFLASLKGAKGLWGFALRVSAISCHPIVLTEEDEGQIARLPKAVQAWVRGSRVEPTIVFREMLDLSRGQLNKVIDQTASYLEQRYRRIHGPTYIFVDKVDQGCKNLAKDVWIHVQAGLIEAAWDLINSNSHIKIYASIRQEAFTHYESDIKVNLYGATTIIRYSRSDLVELMDRLTLCYENMGSFRDFIGLNVVKHPGSAAPEDSFDYIRRHTLGRPRDFVIIASQFSGSRDVLDQSAFCRAVATIGTNVLLSNIFAEIKVFLRCLASSQERNRFCALLPHNIITLPEAKDIWCRFNDLTPVDFEPEFLREAESYDHPFWELYCAGLLGIVEPHEHKPGGVQHFKQPDDQVAEYTQSALPHATHYLIHPILSEYLRNRRGFETFRVFHSAVVGHGCPWLPHHASLCDAERLLFQTRDEGLRPIGHAVLKDVNRLLTGSEAADPRAELSKMPSYEALHRHQGGEDKELLSLWLDELLA